MPSQFAWLDYSELERRKALDVVGLFKDKGTVDELGIGTVRDALADYLFPGISTIQTRAKYFLFIPWIHQALERDKISSRDAPRIARNREVDLIDGLLNSEDHEGVIGRESRGKLQRLPSEIYWVGLQVLGMRRYRGSRTHYYRSLDEFYKKHNQRRIHSDDGIDEVLTHDSRWHDSLPMRPDDFPQKVDLGLSRNEAEYLQQQILAQTPGSMLAHTVSHSPWEATDYPWLHPSVETIEGKLSIVLNDARNFSLVMHGAALLYNLLMAEKQDESIGPSERGVRSARYCESFDEWVGRLEARRQELLEWAADLAVFWQSIHEINPRVHAFTRQFISDWIELALRPGPAKLKNDVVAHELIRKREKRLKGSRARLTNSRALELWGGESGTGRLNFRWSQAQTIITDILSGLERNA